ncbi:MAG: AraC family transcriptional regulator ligand-binding domain-containing protein [Erythrobacter sp.]
MPTHSPSQDNSTYGLRVLVEELEVQGITLAQMLRRAEMRSLSGQITHAQRLAVLRAANEMSLDPLTALNAGQRQRVQHYGVYGYALATSPTFGDAFAFGRQNLELAGAVLRITFRKKGGIGILRSHNPAALGSLLTFAAEFWRSSMSALLSEVLGQPFPSTLMRFPYPRPRHAEAYSDVFHCPIEFDADHMEWHFDAHVLQRPCPSAHSLTAHICQDFCETLIANDSSTTPLQRQLRSFILGKTDCRVTADDASQALALSRRTLFRRLGEEGTSFQVLLDQTRASLACEYLENTRLTVGEISERCGYSDEANFRKAFRRWRQKSPSKWRLIA